jgi:GNAT superfamily N-acetyltransferase
LPDVPEHLELILQWNFRVWGDRIPGYDLEGWRAFYDRALSHAHDGYQGEELVWAILDGSDRCLGSIALVQEDDLEGFDDLTPWIAAFVIDPELRHKGLGRAVVEMVEAWSRVQGIHTLYLWTDIYAPWYASQGYSEVAKTKVGEIDAVVMKKELS